MVLNQGCLWYLIMVKCCTYSVSRYFSWYQIMVKLKISLFLIKVGWKSMVPNQCFKKVYGYYSVLRSGEKSVLWKILWLLIMATMVPDQCCHKINCTYSYMGLNHGTHITPRLSSVRPWSFRRPLPHNSVVLPLEIIWCHSFERKIVAASFLSQQVYPFSLLWRG